MLKRLLESGWTQEEIADACGCAQSTISDLARGHNKNPSFQIGAALAALKPRQQHREKART